MRSFWLKSLCVLLGLLAMQSACKQNDGISKNGDPVNHAQSEKKQNANNKNIINQIKKSAVNDSAQSLKPATFVDRSREMGLDYIQFRDAVDDRYFFPEVMGSGIGFIDFDLDGFWDLYVGNGDALVGESTHNNQLFRNHGGQFENATDVSCDSGAGFAQGIAVGDFNADGFDDLFVANFGRNYLAVNQGDGTFVRQSIGDSSSEPAWSASCILVDLDADGDLDIVVASYLDWSVKNHHPCTYKGVLGYCGPGTYEATHELVYLNNGDGSFSERHKALGFNQSTKGLVVCAADFDGDRIPEIYIGSDLTNNVFYHRKTGQSEFQEMASDAGVATSKNGLAEATMGFAVRDFNNDQRPDMFLTHYYKNKNTLYLNEGNLLFKDASYETRIKALSFDFIGFGTVPIDFDNDSDFDLFIANGHVLGESIPPFRLKPQVLSNEDCRFFDVSEKSGEFFSNEYAGRSVASGDFDNDGDVDIAMARLDQPLAMLVNETKTDRKSIQIQLADWQRRDLTGSSVTVQIGEKRHELPVVKGESYLAAVDPRLHFGAGTADKVTLTVHWSFGGDSTFELLETDACWLLNSAGQSMRLR